MKKADDPLDRGERELIARLDERNLAMQETMKSFVTADAFSPVKMIAYGLAGGALFMILGGILALVVTP